MSHVYKLQRCKEDERDHLLAFRPAIGVNIPKSMDLRPMMFPAFDQGQIGSCTANAGVAYRMFLLARKNPTLAIPMLSRLDLYFYERMIEGTIGTDAGANMRDIGKALAKYGVCTESLFPYDPEKFANIPSPDATNNAGQYKIKAYKSLATLNDVKTYIATMQKPVLMGMEVYPSMETDKVAKTGKVPMPRASESALGGHAVLIVGYRDTYKSNGNLIVRNSWGTEWGDTGHFYLPYEYVTKGLAFDFWTLED